jgi:hypothetical protein
MVGTSSNQNSTLQLGAMRTSLKPKKQKAAASAAALLEQECLERFFALLLMCLLSLKFYLGLISQPGS